MAPLIYTNESSSKFCDLRSSALLISFGFFAFRMIRIKSLILDFFSFFTKKQKFYLTSVCLRFQLEKSSKVEKICQLTKKWQRIFVRVKGIFDNFWNFFNDCTIQSERFMISYATGFYYNDKFIKTLLQVQCLSKVIIWCKIGKPLRILAN